MLTRKIHAISSSILPFSKEGVADDTGIFGLGVDSLDVLALANALKNSISGVNIAAPRIYSNPTTKRLAKYSSDNADQSRE